MFKLNMFFIVITNKLQITSFTFTTKLLLEYLRIMVLAFIILNLHKVHMLVFLSRIQRNNK